MVKNMNEEWILERLAMCRVGIHAELQRLEAACLIAALNFLSVRSSRSQTTVQCRSIQVCSTSSIGRCHQSSEKISISE